MIPTIIDETGSIKDLSRNEIKALYSYYRKTYMGERRITGEKFMEWLRISMKSVDVKPSECMHWFITGEFLNDTGWVRKTIGASDKLDGNDERGVADDAVRGANIFRDCYDNNLGGHVKKIVDHAGVFGRRFWESRPWKQL